jgi:hypothetical protein
VVAYIDGDGNLVNSEGDPFIDTTTGQDIFEPQVTVADSTARFALTGADIRNGEYCKQTDTGDIWMLIDVNQISGGSGWSTQQTSSPLIPSLRWLYQRRANRLNANIGASWGSIQEGDYVYEVSTRTVGELIDADGKATDAGWRQFNGPALNRSWIQGPEIVANNVQHYVLPAGFIYPPGMLVQLGGTVGLILDYIEDDENGLIAQAAIKLRTGDDPAP